MLGVPVTATAAELRAAYQRQALQFHPDRGEGADAERFRSAQQAWEALGVRVLQKLWRAG